MKKKNWYKGLTATAVTLAMAGVVLTVPAFAGDDNQINGNDLSKDTSGQNQLNAQPSVPTWTGETNEKPELNEGTLPSEEEMTPPEFNEKVPTFDKEKPTIDEEKPETGDYNVPETAPVVPEQPEAPVFDETLPEKPNVDGMETGDANDLIGDYNQSANDYNSKLDQYKQELEGFEQKVNDYNSKLDEYVQDSSEYQTAVGNYNTAVNNYKNAVDEYNKLVEEYNKAVADYEQKVEDYNDKADKYNTAIENYEAALKDYNDKIAAYNEEAKKWNDAVDAYNKQVADWNDSLTESAENVEEKNQEIVEDNQSIIDGNNTIISNTSDSVGQFTGENPGAAPVLGEEESDTTLGNYQTAVDGYNSKVDEYNAAVDAYNQLIQAYNKSQADSAVGSVNPDNIAQDTQNGAIVGANGDKISSNDELLTGNGDAPLSAGKPQFNLSAPTAPDLSGLTNVKVIQAAIDQYNQEVTAYNNALAAYNAAVDAYNAAVNQYNGSITADEEQNTQLTPQGQAAISQQMHGENIWWIGSNDAEFYIRYDGNVQFENGSTQYDSGLYFRVDNPDLETDGVVVNRNPTVHVDDTQNLISDGKVDENELKDKYEDATHWWDSEFNAEDGYKDELEKVFEDVSDNIKRDPDKVNKGYVYQQISTALGVDTANRYANGDVAILWYVIKTASGENNTTVLHVDGVLYDVKTGEIITQKDKLETLEKLDSNNELDTITGYDLIGGELLTLQGLTDLTQTSGYYEEKTDKAPIFSQIIVQQLDDISKITADVDTLDPITDVPEIIEYTPAVVEDMEFNPVIPPEAELMEYLEDAPETPETPEYPYTPDIPVIDDDGGDDTVIDDEDVPLVSGDDTEDDIGDYEEIDDDDTPLTDGPTDDEIDDIIAEIEDEVVPLANVPQTGVPADNGMNGAAAAGAAGIAALAAAVLLRKARRSR